MRCPICSGYIPSGLEIKSCPHCNSDIGHIKPIEDAQIPSSEPPVDEKREARSTPDLRAKSPNAFRRILDFGHKRSVLGAFGFCLIFYFFGMAVAFAVGLLEHFLFTGHKFKHIISGGRFIALLELWIVCYLIINAKRLYKDWSSILMMAIGTVLCIFGSIFYLLPVGVLAAKGRSETSGAGKATTAFRSIAILIPVGLIVYESIFIGVIPAIGIESVRSMSQIAKNPEIVGQRNEVANAASSYSKVRFNDPKAAAIKGYEFVVVLIKHRRLYDSKNVLEEIDPIYLDDEKRSNVEKLRGLAEKYSNRTKNSLHHFASEIDRGYCTDSDRSASLAQRSGQYADAADKYARVFETLGCERMMAAFDLVEVFKQLKQPKNANYLVGEIKSALITNEHGIKKLNTMLQEISAISKVDPNDGKYQERYEKFKAYKSRYLSAKQIDPKTQPDQAETEFKAALEIAPTIVDVIRTRLMLANTYYESAQYEKALTEIEWLKANLAKANDRMVDSLDWNEWQIEQSKIGADPNVDPIVAEAQKILKLS
jgi:tetratricopeptide (TPR) repeat protein